MQRAKPYPRPGVERGNGEPLNLLEIYACLIDRGHSKAELETLDDFWLYHVYWHPRDKTGNVAIRSKGKAAVLTRKDYWLAWGKELGVPEWYAVDRWEQEQADTDAKRQAKHAAKHKAAKRGR